jgi:hypothetical protein
MWDILSKVDSSCFLFFLCIDEKVMGMLISSIGEFGSLGPVLVNMIEIKYSL